MLGASNSRSNAPSAAMRQLLVLEARAASAQHAMPRDDCRQCVSDTGVAVRGGYSQACRDLELLDAASVWMRPHTPQIRSGACEVPVHVTNYSLAHQFGSSLPFHCPVAGRVHD